MLKINNHNYLWLINCYNENDSEFVSTETESELIFYIVREKNIVINVLKVDLDGTLEKFNYKDSTLYKMLTKDNKKVNRKKEYY